MIKFGDITLTSKMAWRWARILLWALIITLAIGALLGIQPIAELKPYRDWLVLGAIFLVAVKVGRVRWEALA